MAKYMADTDGLSYALYKSLSPLAYFMYHEQE